MKGKPILVVGILILVFIAISYFIPITLNSNYGYNVSGSTKTSLLGVLIFYNPLVLAGYILIGLFLVYIGLKNVKIKIK